MFLWKSNSEEFIKNFYKIMDTIFLCEIMQGIK